MAEMMSTILVIGIICYLASFLLLWLSRDVAEITQGVDAWRFATIAGAIGYISLLTYNNNYPKHAELIYNISLLFWAVFLYIGGHHRLDKPIRQEFLLYLTGAVACLVVTFGFIWPAFFISNTILALYIGTLNLHLGYIFIKENKKRKIIASLLGSCLILSGLHWFDYPFFRYNPIIGPFGFLLCSTLSMIITTLVVKIVLRDFYDKMRTAEQEAINKAFRDPLTGVNNRFYLDQEFPKLLTLTKNKTQDLALVFCDLNKFKAINDNYGHHVGDRALIIFAKRIRSAARQSDLIIRLGGDEFLIVLNQLEYANYQLVTDFIARLVNSMKRPISIDGVQHQLDTSIGVSYLSKHGDNLEHLLDVADQAMYSDKMMKRRNELSLTLKPISSLPLIELSKNEEKTTCS